MEQNKLTKKSVSYWALRPLTILKSSVGWKVKEQVPKWAFLLVWLESSILIFIFLMLTSYIGIVKDNAPLSEMKHNFIIILEGAPIIGIGILVSPIIIILGILKKIFQRN